MPKPVRRLVPLELKHIEEGRFLDDLEGDIRKAQAELIRFAEKYGEQANKAKATIAVKIDMTFHASQDAYTITAQVKTTQPSRPKSAGIAMASVAPDGDQPALFVREAGADEVHPAQGKFCTSDGRRPDGATLED